MVGEIDFFRERLVRGPGIKAKSPLFRPIHQPKALRIIMPTAISTEPHATVDQAPADTMPAKAHVSDLAGCARPASELGLRAKPGGRAKLVQVEAPSADPATVEMTETASTIDETTEKNEEAESLEAADNAPKSEIAQPTDVLPIDNAQTSDVQSTVTMQPTDVLANDAMVSDDVRPADVQPADAMQSSDAMQPADVLPADVQPADAMQSSDLQPADDLKPADAMQSSDAMEPSDVLPSEALQSSPTPDLSDRSMVSEQADPAQPTGAAGDLVRFVAQRCTRFEWSLSPVVAGRCRAPSRAPCRAVRVNDPACRWRGR